MALQKSNTQDTGHNGDYWRILSIEQDQESDVCRVKIALYKSQTDRDAGKEPMELRRYEYNAFTDAEMDPLNQNIVERAYEELKLHADFSGATDV